MSCVSQYATSHSHDAKLLASIDLNHALNGRPFFPSVSLSIRQHRDDRPTCARGSNVNYMCWTESFFSFLYSVDKLLRVRSAHSNGQSATFLILVRISVFSSLRSIRIRIDWAHVNRWFDSAHIRCNPIKWKHIMEMIWSSVWFNRNRIHSSVSNESKADWFAI